MSSIKRGSLSTKQLELVLLLTELYREMKTGALDLPDITQRVEEASLLAAALRKWLLRSGFEVEHTSHVVENRGVSPDDPTFYNQFHLIEELVQMCSV